MKVWASDEARVLNEYVELEEFISSINATLGPVVKEIFYKGKKFLQSACDNKMQVRKKELDELELFCRNIEKEIKSQIKIVEKDLNIKISK